VARFESELLAAKSTTVKEAIRLGHMNIGDFYYQRGNLMEALKSYMRTKDFCTQGRHAFDMYINAISISIDLDQYRNISSYVPKALAVSTDAESKAKLKCITGLQALNDCNYSVAGKLFCEVGLDVGNFSGVIAVEDIVLYGVLCCMASMGRLELRAYFDQPAFKTQLELAPNVRQFIQDYFTSKFASCKQFLLLMIPQWKLDVYLRNHVDAIVSKILERFLVACFTPYSSMYLQRMAVMTSTDLTELEYKLTALIATNQLSARIDKFQALLIREVKNDKEKCVVSVVDQSNREASYIKRSLVRLSMLKHNMCVTNSDITQEGAFICEVGGNDDEIMDDTN
jgi:COP9 signalosome complex subunit 1